MAERNGVLALLASGIPLSLLLDLALPNGPDSARIARTERPDPAED